jgi:uncharacterized protein
MDELLRGKLIDKAKGMASKDDITHDFEHALRVLANAEMISREEGGDMDVIVPAALFHDIIVYPKNDLRSKNAQEESAAAAKSALEGLDDFPKEKIEAVRVAIMSCSFSKGIVPDSIEAKIIQDSDGLEATGAISVMRTFSSTGQMKRMFYDPSDPFCRGRKPEDLKFALDLFFTRLLKVAERMHTNSARMIAERRTVFLKSFLDELRMELEGK